MDRIVGALTTTTVAERARARRRGLSFGITAVRGGAINRTRRFGALCPRARLDAVPLCAQKNKGGGGEA